MTNALKHFGWAVLFMLVWLMTSLGLYIALYFSLAFITLPFHDLLGIDFEYMSQNFEQLAPKIMPVVGLMFACVILISCYPVWFTIYRFKRLEEDATAARITSIVANLIATGFTALLYYLVAGLLWTLWMACTTSEPRPDLEEMNTLVEARPFLIAALVCAVLRVWLPSSGSSKNKKDSEEIA